MKIDIPPLGLNEIVAIVTILTAAIPFTLWALVALVGRWFVSKKKYYADQRKVSQVLEGQLKMISDGHNKQVQAESKNHELLAAIKGLSHEVSEQKQVTRDNTTATIRLSEKMAVIEDRQTRGGG